MSKNSANKKSLSMLEWRKKQKTGAIMKPSTFEKIVEKAKKEYGVGEERAKKIAGKAYWQTVEKKYREFVRKRKTKDE